MAKRMNLPETDLTESVATAEEVYKTNKEIPDLLHKTCVGGLDSVLFVTLLLLVYFSGGR